MDPYMYSLHVHCFNRIGKLLPAYVHGYNYTKVYYV